MEEDMTDGVVDPQGVVDEALKVPEPVVPAPPVPPVPPVPPAAPTIPPITPVAPVVETPVSPPMNPDVPLAFVPPAPGVTPVAPAPAPTIPVEPPKKKSKLGVVLAGIVGLFVVLGGSVAGYLYYTENLPPSKSTIANIQTQYPTKESCVGVCNNNRLLRWDAKNGRCEDSGKSCDASTSTEATGITKDKCVGGNLAWCDGCGGYCMRYTAGGFGCHQMSAAKCGEYPQLGGNIVDCDSTQALTKCDKPGQCGKCFDTYGECIHETTPGVPDGLCAIVPMTETNTTGVTNYYFCENVFSNLAGGCNTEGKPKNMSCYCGTLQIDGPNGFTSQTMKCGCGGEKSPNPSTSVNYSMSCTGLTKNVATPTIGSKITFTCAGATVPAAGASLLRYNFRYQLDGGAWRTLTNKTNSTTELTVDACGTYAVQCRACVTYGGTTTCDPVWQGASQ